MKKEFSKGEEKSIRIGMKPQADHKFGLFCTSVSF